MKSLAKDLEKILDAESRRDFDWGRFDWRLWNGPLIQAREALVAIEKAVSLLKRVLATGCGQPFWPRNPEPGRLAHWCHDSGTKPSLKVRQLLLVHLSKGASVTCAR
jgi:hypothetical protein